VRITVQLQLEERSTVIEVGNGYVILLDTLGQLQLTDSRNLTPQRIQQQYYGCKSLLPIDDVKYFVVAALLIPALPTTIWRVQHKRSRVVLLARFE